MRRIGKKVVLILLAAVLSLAGVFYLQSDTAKAMKKPGRLDGVDYTRIRQNKDLSVKVQFTVGTYQFEGELTNGKTLSNDEIDKIIDGVMDEMNITAGMLEFSNSIIEQAKHLKGIDPAVAVRIGLNIAGFGTMIDLCDMYHGKKPIPEGLTGIVIGEISGEVVKALTGKKWADVILNAFLSTKDIAAEWTRIQREREIAELAMQREILLSVFYDECNRRLKAAEEERGTSYWNLKVNDVKTKNKTLFDFGIKQNMRLTVDMERVSSYGEKTVSNWSGIYQGSIRIEIWHDLSQFDTNFPMLFTNASNVFNKMQGIYKTLPDSAKESSKLTKVVTLSDAEIQIDKRNAVGTTVTKNVPLAGAEDVSNFKLSHVVSYALVLGPWEDGKLDIFGSGASYHSEVGMNEQCSGTVLEGNRYPAIVWDSHEVVAWDELLAPSGAGWSKRALAGNGTTNLGRPAIVDYQIFNDLRDNQITLWIKNIERGTN